MPAIKGQFLNYSEKVMKEAIQDVRTNNTPVRTAAKKCGVPWKASHPWKGKWDLKPS